MPFTNTNDYLTGRAPAVFPAGSEVVAVRYAVNLVANDLDANDAGSVGILPAGCIPVGLIVDSDDLDTNASPTVAMSVGLMNAADTDLAATWATGITVGQAGGSVQPALSAAAMRTAATLTDRRVGIRFTAGAATKAAGQVGITLLYRAV